MAKLFFYSIEDVVDWMGGVIAEKMESNQKDCDGNRSNLTEHVKDIMGGKKESVTRLWWFVRKDGAQMGSTFDMLVACVNHYIVNFERPDFTVYSIAYAPTGKNQWVVSW